jgi:histidinol-phosphate phosphatase family protein
MVVAIIVAGGQGTRARSMTGERLPKALLPVNGTPIIVHQLRYLAREHVQRVGILAGHLGQLLGATAQKEAKGLGLDVTVAIETEPLGTAGGLPALAPMIDQEDMLVMYGDVVFDLALDRLVAHHRQSGALATVVAHPNDHPETSDLLVTDDHDHILSLLPRRGRPQGDYRNLVPAAIYVCQARVLQYLEAGIRTDFIHDLFPRLLAADERLVAYSTSEYLRDMGTPERFATAEADLRSGLVAAYNARRLRPALFFDCDGVLNEEPGGHGVLSPDDLRLLPGAALAIRQARSAGFITVGVTNKPQVAKGMVAPEGLQHILGRLEMLLAREGAILDRLYACPHHSERGFAGEVSALKIACDCRKPAPGMLLRAMRDLPIDRARSAIVGDSWRDLAAGQRAGVYAYAVRSGHGCRGLPPEVRPNAWFDDVADAVDFAVNYRARAASLWARLLMGSTSQPTVVAICGQSQSGKSLLAHALCRSLIESGQSCLHVRLDDWIVPLDQRSPGMTALERNRVALYSELVRALRRGEAITAPGYDAETRTAGPPRTYDAAGARFVIVDGILAAHALVRNDVDLSVFVEAKERSHRDRLSRFYAWKQLTPAETRILIQERRLEEWPIVEAQRSSADVIMEPQAGPSGKAEL